MKHNLVWALFMISGLVACASSAAPNDAPSTPATSGPPRPACDEIAKVCHGHDEHGGAMRDCHLMGHSPRSTNEICEAKRAECREACK